MTVDQFQLVKPSYRFDFLWIFRRTLERMKLISYMFATQWIICLFAAPQNYQEQNSPTEYYSEGRQSPGYSSGEVESRAAGNSKFAGQSNQEEGRFYHRRRRYRGYRRRRPQPVRDPCYRRRAAGRYNNNGGNRGSQPKEQGRFLWDLNVYNYYPGARPTIGLDDYDCGGYGGNGGYDEYYEDPLYPVYGGFGNFLALFSPGGALNPRPGQGNRPRPPVAAPINGGDVDSNVDPSNPDDIYDPVYEDPPNRPLYDQSNRPLYDQARPPSVGNLVGGTASLVNNVIQTLSGNQAISRRRSYGGYNRRPPISTSTTATMESDGGPLNTVSNAVSSGRDLVVDIGRGFRDLLF